MPTKWGVKMISVNVHNTAQKMKFYIKDIFSKCDQIGHIYWRNP